MRGWQKEDDKHKKQGHAARTHLCGLADVAVDQLELIVLEPHAAQGLGNARARVRARVVAQHSDTR